MYDYIEERNDVLTHKHKSLPTYYKTGNFLIKIHILGVPNNEDNYETEYGSGHSGES